MEITHNSRSLDYRKPFGAAETSTDVLLSIKIDDCEVGSAWLEIRRDDEGQYHKIQLQEMASKKQEMVSQVAAEAETIEKPARQGSHGSIFAVRIKVPDTPCLLWYRFRIVVKTGDACSVLYYCNNKSGLGGEGRIVEGNGELTPYQITVYRKAETPKWYKDGIVYQIFPDRFARDDDWRERCEAANRSVNERRDDTKRILEDDWYKLAYYKRGADNKVTGWPIYGGSLKGIEEKLDYLKSLGISAIYLNPIFEATSNHRYDTGNYMKIDPALGTEEDFRHLAEAAREKGIRLILDGVFSHTGQDSIYFDRFGNYPQFGDSPHFAVGAWQSEDSPYRSWYKFDPSERCGYKSWWGVEDLPEVDENNESYRNYILGEQGVVSHWLEAGASGWRLDVADELPDSFIKAMRARVKSSKSDGLLIGEVWEDASNKISYGERREYFAGDELDGTMNYPIRDILLDYINYTIGSGKAGERLMSLAENYPRENFYGALNLIGSHDRERILTMMAADKDYDSAVSKVRLLSILQYTLPGVPCVYYGDEAGLQGNADPENRSCFPWGRENEGLKFHYRMLGLIYNEHPVLKDGDFTMLSGPDVPGGETYAAGGETEAADVETGVLGGKSNVAVAKSDVADSATNVPADDTCAAGSKEPRTVWDNDDVLAFIRSDKNERILVLVNRSYGKTEVDLSRITSRIDSLKCGYALDLLTSSVIKPDESGSLGKIQMDSLSAKIICLLDSAPEKEEIERSAGVICHLTSLAGSSIKDSTAKDSILEANADTAAAPLGKPAYDFVDYIADAGFRVWQVLPVNPLGLGNSPYVSTSAFAGEPKYVDKNITKAQAEAVIGFDEFVKNNDEWLTEYVAFTVLQEMEDGLPWYEWPDEYKFGDPHEVLEKLSGEHAEPVGRIRELQMEQYLFYVEWQKLREYAHSKGVKIMGDIPMYVGMNSADVWANKEVFQLDENGRLKVHAGVPPDYFSADGQDWGNPLYDWDALEARNYDWWMRRLKQCAERFDILRIDHFRGLSEYYAIPQGHKPVDGLWQKGPGLRFVKAAKAMLIEKGLDMKLVAEDLGSLDAEVLNLIKLSGLPGMNVWQFSEHDMMNMPAEEAENRAFYAGTHDNNTLLGFYEESDYDSKGDSSDIAPEAKTDVSASAKEAAEIKALDAIQKIFESHARLAMVQLQDVFMLGEEARMNVPGVPEGNWTWEIPGRTIEEAFPDAKKRADLFRTLIKQTGRL